MSKGEETKTSILDEALHLASRVGFEGLTIGQLAEQTEMSKSGLFAHFQSKEQLQLQTLDHAPAAFIDTVVRPALKGPAASAGPGAVRALAQLGDRGAGRRLRLRHRRRSSTTTSPARCATHWSASSATGSTRRHGRRTAVAEGEFRSDLDPGSSPSRSRR